MFRSIVGARAFLYSGKKKEGGTKSNNTALSSTKSQKRVSVYATQVRWRRDDEENARRKGAGLAAMTNLGLRVHSRGDAVGVGVQGLFRERTGGVGRVE